MCLWKTFIGIDIWATVVLKYSGDRMASVFYHGLQETPCQASISGPNGQLKVSQINREFIVEFSSINGVLIIFSYPSSFGVHQNWLKVWNLLMTRTLMISHCPRLNINSFIQILLDCVMKPIMFMNVCVMVSRSLNSLFTS